MSLDDQIKEPRYVLVSEHDGGSRHACLAISFEQFMHSADLKSVKRFRKRLGDKYGATRIARLVFLTEEELS